MKENKRSTGLSDYIQHSKLPPQNLSAEEVVLGAIMIETGVYEQVSNMLHPECFYKESHQKIYTAFQALRLKKEPIDTITVIQQLKKTGELEVVGGPYYLTQLTNRVASSANILTHALYIYEPYLKREVIRICNEKTTNAYDDSTDVFDEIDNLLYQGLELKKIKTDKITTLNQELLLLSEHIENNKTFEIATTGYLTGFYCLDKHTGGLQKTDLIVIAGETSHGKTSFTMQMILNACKNPDVKAVIYSLEMSNQQLTARLLANESGVDFKTILFSKTDEASESAINTGVNNLSGVNIYFDAGANSDIMSIVNSIHALKIKYDINIAVVDYLQQISFRNSNKKTDEQINDICKLLKATAKELDIPIVLVSQFSREESRTHKYTLASLKGSSGIEQNADLVIFIQSPAIFGQNMFEYPFDDISTTNKTLVEVMKGRNYGLTKFILEFDLATNKLSNFDKNKPNMNF